jgi:HPt (histidine-containing phosphotransfer) domain-containing protein
MLATNGSSILDRAEMLERCGGDKALLAEIAGIFLSEYPSLLQQIQAALTDRDAHRLERAAHTLKGAVSNFGAPFATQAAFELEQLGRQRRFEGAEEAVAHLEAELSALHPVLAELSAY